MKFNPEGIVFDHIDIDDSQRMGTLLAAWKNAATEEEQSQSSPGRNESEFIDAAESMGRLHAAYAIAGLEFVLDRHKNNAFFSEDSSGVHWVNRLAGATNGLYDEGLQFFVLKNNEVAQAVDVLDRFQNLPLHGGGNIRLQQNAKRLSALISTHQVPA
jgi:hypothetical protein